MHPHCICPSNHKLTATLADRTRDAAGASVLEPSALYNSTVWFQPTYFSTARRGTLACLSVTSQDLLQAFSQS